MGECLFVIDTRPTASPISYFVPCYKDKLGDNMLANIFHPLQLYADLRMM